jgi:hypothetical protein
VDASNAVAAPAAPGLTVTFATGAWSGVIAIARGLPATVTAVPAALAAVSIGVTLSAAPLTTYAVLPEGATAIPTGLAPASIAPPAALVAVVIGVTLLASVFAT